ncbi:hypothetical protein H4582DRAFT_1538049, partial [Lactarius indigo]
KRLSDGGVAPEYHPRSDSARLQNIGRFLTDIKDTLREMNTQWWTSNNAESIRRERRALFDTRHSEEYGTGHGTFDKKRDRGSPAFVPAAQQDLVTLTLEILARGPIANVATSRSDAFREAYRQFMQAALTEASIQAQTQVLPRSPSEYETRARIRTLAADSSDMVKRALQPVLRSLQLETVEISPSQDNTSPPQVLVPPIVPDTAAATVNRDNEPEPSHAASAGAKEPPAQRSSPGPIASVPSLPYSTASSSAWREANPVDSGHSPV